MAAVAAASLLGLTVGCASLSARTDRPCVLSPDVGAPYEAASAEELRGEYELVIVSTWARETGESLRGRLHLEPTDSLHRFYEQNIFGRQRRVPARPLWGWANFPPSHITIPWGTAPTSHDPDHPGVLLEASGRVALGPFLMLDGTSATLVIERVTPAGFSGRWGSSLGNIRAVDEKGAVLPDPNGYFCALRR